ncbi:MAG: hypothetical protein R2798_06075 [Chitinophagales bacterium]|nr:hypothetical protein [Bacteroidota bacterium]
MKTKYSWAILGVVLYLTFFSSCIDPKWKCVRGYRLFLDAYTTDITQPLHVGDTLTYWFHFSDTLVDSREGYKLYLPDKNFNFLQYLIRVYPEATYEGWEWEAGPEELSLIFTGIGDNFSLDNGTAVGIVCDYSDGYYNSEVKYLFNKAGFYYFYISPNIEGLVDDYDPECINETFLWGINVNNGADNNIEILDIINDKEMMSGHKGNFHTWGSFCVEVVE